MESLCELRGTEFFKEKVDTFETTKMVLFIKKLTSNVLVKRKNDNLLCKVEMKYLSDVKITRSSIGASSEKNFILFTKDCIQNFCRDSKLILGVL